MTDTDFERFLSGYIECALWCGVIDERTECPECEGDGCDECDDGTISEPGQAYTGDDLDESDLDDDAREQIERDARDFWDANLGNLNACGLDPEQCGHDFWLTRNRHGAGFWDRKHRGVTEDMALDRLTDASHVYGEVTLVLGDSGKVGVL